jgi:uncharacterized iron-regulated membrane protein
MLKKLRPHLLRIHRWAGVSIALLLILTGVTGALLAHQRTINPLLAPDIWLSAPPSADSPMLSGVELANRAEAASGGLVTFIPLHIAPNRAQPIYVNAPSAGAPLVHNLLFMDPYSGAVRASIQHGKLAEGPANVMPFIMDLHYSLTLGGLGRAITGWGALIWCFVSLIGVILALPPRRSGEGAVARLLRWPRHNLAGFKTDRRFHAAVLHRGVAFVVWPVMLLFAWSAVTMNLDMVHGPVHQLMGGKGLYRPVANPQPASGTPMESAAAVDHGARLMAKEAAAQGFDIIRAETLSRSPWSDSIGYFALTSLDGSATRGATAIWFDAVSGKMLEFRHPYGDNAADAADKWLHQLHIGGLWGLPHRLFLSVFGLLVATLSVSGLAMFIRRRRLRSNKKGRG